MAERTRPARGRNAVDGRAGRGTAAPLKRNQGLGRILVMVYAVFALSSFARSLYQVLVHFDEAPLAYLLSGFAAVVYIVATLALARSGPTAWTVSVVAVGIELLGVVAIGLWTALDPQLFADDTVWSRFGAGYGYVPLVLPILGMAWLLTHRPANSGPGHGPGEGAPATASGTDPVRPHR